MMRGLFIRNLKDFAEDTKKHSKLTLYERLTEHDDHLAAGANYLSEMSPIMGGSGIA